MELVGGARGGPTPHFSQIEGAGAAQRELEALLGHCFSVPAGSSFYDDFPVWDRRHGASLLRVGARVAGRMVATAAIRFTSLRTPGGTLEVGLIGAVATDEAFRGKGLGSHAVELLIEAARWRRTPLLLLWGGEHSMYRRLGFELCGEQAQVALERVSSAPAPDVRRGWTAGILSCLRGRRDGLVIREVDLPWIAAHRNVDWWWTGNPDLPSAYAAVGRGIDLGGLVHEWGGETKALHALLATLRREISGLSLLGHPLALSAIGFEAAQKKEFLCMARVLDSSKVFSSFRPGQALPALGPVQDGKLGPALFGPTAEISVPLPLWLWGLDGV